MWICRYIGEKKVAQVLNNVCFDTTGRVFITRYAGLTIKPCLGWLSLWVPSGLECPNDQTSVLIGQAVQEGFFPF